MKLRKSIFVQMQVELAQYSCHLCQKTFPSALQRAPAGPKRMRHGCTVKAVAATDANTWELVAILGAFWNQVSLPNATLLARLGEILKSVCRQYAYWCEYLRVASSS